MVKITRENTRNHYRGGGNRQQSSLFSLRNIILFLVLFQGYRFLTVDKSKLTNFEKEVEDGIIGIEDELKRNFRGKANKPTPAPENKMKEDEHHANPYKNEEDESDDDPEKESVDESNDELGEKEPDVENLKDAIDNEEVKDDSNENKKNDLNRIVIEKKGTGPTKVGYVKDFVDERANPAYKHIEAPIINRSSEIAKMTNEKSVVPCLDGTKGGIHQKCLDQDTPLVAYNSESFVRTWCGQEIQPQSAVVMEEHCTDPVSDIFPVAVPPVKGEHMPPIVIKKSNGKPKELEDVQCNISCQQEKGINFGVGDTGSTYYIDGESWKILMDDKRMTRADFVNDQFLSSLSLKSSIPLSYYDVKIHSLRNRPAVDFDTAENKAIYLVNDECNAPLTNRNRWFDAVQNRVKVDSFGKCGHNAEVPAGMTIDTPEGRIALSKKYKIVLALDNGNAKDYITNVVWEAFVSGAVPVVAGAENIATRVPVHSFINVKDYKKWDDLADYVEKVMSDKELWLSYHKWRDDPAAIEKVEAQNYFANTGATCRFCRWAYAKKYGLGWDETKQEVRDVPKVPKEKFCSTADHGLVAKPFAESWVTRTSGGSNEEVFEEEADSESCSSLSIEGGISVGSYRASRKVFQHDGVTDFIILDESMDDSQDSEISLRLTFPHVRNPEGAFFYNTHTMVSTAKGTRVSSASIQDNAVKITVLANWDTTVKSTGEGVMEVVIKNNSAPISTGDPLKRVRVIIEEINTVLDKMTEFFPSPYCKQMTNDFINPIAVYFVES